jgi:hypothetical protein
MKYDFEYLKNLYIADPVEFKKVTDSMLDEFITNRPDDQQQIYRAKQWRLEQELSKIHDPVARMNKFVPIFWEGVNKFVEATKNLDTLVKSVREEGTEPSAQVEDSHEVLDFKKKSDV